MADHDTHDHTGVPGVGVGDASAHIADATDAHDASAISFSPTGTIAATDVQAAIAEVATEAAGGGAPPDCKQAFLTTSDVTIVNASTAYDFASLSLTTGDWLVEAEAEVSSASAGATHFGLQIYDAGTVYKFIGTYREAGNATGSVAIAARVRITLGSTTTVKAAIISTRGSSDGAILRTSLNNGTADKCSSIMATKVTAA